MRLSGWLVPKVWLSAARSVEVLLWQLLLDLRCDTAMRHSPLAQNSSLLAGHPPDSASLFGGWGFAPVGSCCLAMFVHEVAAGVK